MVDEAGQGGGEQESWVVQVDRRWNPSNPSETPPSSMILGGWMLDGDTAGPFQPNPNYIPSGDDVPCDPVDAVLRLAADDADDVGADIISAIRNSVVEIGCDEDDQPLIGFAPDGVACIVVATAAVYKRGVEVKRWNAAPGSVLPQIVPTNVDIMLNPAGPAPFRLRTEALGQD
ncbi:type VII secretion system-associated protein [Nocardia sp. CY41]|uniref:type VII secretion system-associated protein n=1 Tax=Nocardia sp. CY41 TaxID=2608686 RepID=UPI001358BDAA|nr:type VII secretion system-associated protein [Nocardia sp. CY41]